jgi:hypothetical protein
MAKANTKASKTGELELGIAILELLKDGKIWTNAEVKAKLKHSFDWSDEDLKVGARGEHKWLGRVNNALSSDERRQKSLVNQSRVKRVGHGEFRITELGRKDLTGELLDELINEYGIDDID